jgi:hypothetical protein
MNLLVITRARSTLGHAETRIPHRTQLKLPPLHIFLIALNVLSAQDRTSRIATDSIPSDLPLPQITTLKNPADGYIFATVPFWGEGNSYLVLYDNLGKPVSYRRTPGYSSDFKVQENGLLTYYDYASQKFFAMDSSLTVVDSFWTKNGFTTDEHDIKMLENGNVLIIGYAAKGFDMSQYVQGGDRNASVLISAIQEIDRNRNVVFEWKDYEHYKFTDVGPAVNLLDPSFIYSRINSVDLDLDGNLIISTRNLDEITKIHRKTGSIIWRLGGKNNQFRFLLDTIGFSAQHSAKVLPNGNLLIFDDGLYHTPHFSRAIEYKLDTVSMTATMIWSYRHSPDIRSVFWGNAQRLKNGNTLIGWGRSDTAATEVDPKGEPVFEMTFPHNIFSYRIFRFPFKMRGGVSGVSDAYASSDFALEQNFPNPFNPLTTITYDLSAETHIVLKVFDILGREVVTLENEKKQSGRHTSVFNPKNLPSGVYIYRIQAGSATRSRSMLYLK